VLEKSLPDVLLGELSDVGLLRESAAQEREVVCLAEELRPTVDRCGSDAGFELLGDVRVDFLRIELGRTVAAEVLADGLEVRRDARRKFAAHAIVLREFIEEIVDAQAVRAGAARFGRIDERHERRIERIDVEVNEKSAVAEPFEHF
jgi:hypothetical protein